MPRITLELLRKRSEHNECIISTLEELSLHQEELEKIELIGTRCRRLRILYLQNNIIEKIEDLTHMKELRYLNLALNNISKIEGLQACEFLEKLDLTVNFVDFDELEDSIDHLKPLRHLRELYMLGNPCQSTWPEGFRDFVVASLPQLEMLDGKEIHRSDRIKALQVFAERERYVREQAVRVRLEKAEKAAAQRADDDVINVTENGATDISPSVAEDKPSILDSQEKVPYTPETRREMYMELAEQKEEQEARRRENMPRERDTEAEHEAALRKARREEDPDGHDIRQCNEGKWDFRFFDEDLEIVLEVDLPRFLDTSLIDVDVHPSYVSMVIKNKLLRLRFPELVHSDQGKAERSKVTGTLRLTLPKAHVTATQQLRAQLKREERERQEKEAKKKTTMAKPTGSADNEAGGSRTRRLDRGPAKLSDEVLAAAQSHELGRPSGVKLRALAPNIRKTNQGAARAERGDNQVEHDAHRSRELLTPILSKTPSAAPVGEELDEPPLLF
ncbi:hypothetical protein ATCC90586_002678 [Pythium insidiosum]|nr:hypothetical protein ATCC90586_002678 [Pythium insidiosum]